MNAKIEWVGLDRDNNMDVPKSWENVGWYSPGYLPGSVGNAVIDGHLDSPFGPAVFWRLSELNQGDMVQVTDSNNNIYKATLPILHIAYFLYKSNQSRIFKVLCGLLVSNCYRLVD